LKFEDSFILDHEASDYANIMTWHIESAFLDDLAR